MFYYNDVPMLSLAYFGVTWLVFIKLFPELFYFWCNAAGKCPSRSWEIRIQDFCRKSKWWVIHTAMCIAGSIPLCLLRYAQEETWSPLKVPSVSQTTHWEGLLLYP